MSIHELINVLINNFFQQSGFASNEFSHKHFDVKHGLTSNMFADFKKLMGAKNVSCQKTFDFNN